MMGNYTDKAQKLTGNPEFRLFIKLQVDNDKDYYNNYVSAFKAENVSTEDRIDLYITPIGYKDANKFGLKFRNCEFRTISENKTIVSSMLELKVMSGKLENGTEYWNKIISKTFKEKVLAQVVESPKENKCFYRQNGEIYKIKMKKIHQTVLDVLSTIPKTFSDYYEQLTLGNFKYTLCFKNRVSRSIEEVYLKLSSFSKFSESNFENYFRSLCVEGYIKNNDIKDIEKQSHNTEQQLIFGYPQLIENF
jgi:hypothetical protein